MKSCSKKSNQIEFDDFWSKLDFFLSLRLKFYLIRPFWATYGVKLESLIMYNFWLITSWPGAWHNVGHWRWNVSWCIAMHQLMHMRSLKDLKPLKISNNIAFCIEFHHHLTSIWSVNCAKNRLAAIV